MNIYATADEHLGHGNLLKFRKRFLTLEEMDEYILNQVRVLDEEAEFSGEPITLYHLGDTIWGNPKHYIPLIRGRAFVRHIFLHGSHDRKSLTDAFGVLIYHKGIPVWMTHDPLHGNADYPVNLVGHVHHLWKYRIVCTPQNTIRTVLVNVGVDKWNYKPVRIEDAIGLAKFAAPHLFSKENIMRYSSYKERTFVDLDEKGEKE